MAPSRYIGVADYGDDEHDNNGQYMAMRRHIVNVNTAKEYMFPAVFGRVGSLKHHIIADGTGVNAYAEKKKADVLVPSDMPESFWYAIADSLIDLYAFANYRTQFAPSTTFPDYFEKVWKNSGASREDVCGYLAEYLAEKSAGKADTKAISLEYKVSVVIAELTRVGDMYKYSYGTPMKIDVYESNVDKKYAVFIAKIAGYYHRVERIDGVHGNYFHCVKIINKIDPESDAVISNKIAEIHTAIGGRNKRIKINEVQTEIQGKIISAVVPDEAAEWKFLENGFTMGNFVNMTTHAHTAYYAMDDPSVSPMGDNDTRLLHNMLHNLNTGAFKGREIDMEVFSNDGVFYSSDTGTKWNTDKHVYNNGTFFVAMAEILLDQVYSNPFFLFRIPPADVPIGKYAPDEILYRLEDMEYGRVVGNDIWGVSKYEAARDQLAENILNEFPIASHSTGDFIPSYLENIDNDSDAVHDKLDDWGVSMKILELNIHEKSARITDSYEHNIPVGSPFAISMLYSYDNSVYFMPRKINNFDFNPLPYFNMYRYNPGALQMALSMAPDKKGYLDSTDMSAALEDLSHAIYLKEPDPRDPSITPDSTGVYYMMDISEYPIDQMDYDKITNHIIKINTNSKLDLVFDMWFDNHELAQGYDPLFNTFEYALAKGFHSIIDNGYIYEKHRGGNDLFPGASDNMPGSIPPITYGEKYAIDSPHASKISVICSAIRKNDIYGMSSAALVTLLNQFDVRLSITRVKHSRTGVMYIDPTTRDAAPGSYGALGNRAADYYNGGNTSDKMTAPMNFAIVLAEITVGADTKYGYVDILDVSEVIPTTYMSKVAAGKVKMASSIAEIWGKTGGDKKAKIKKLYDDGKLSIDSATVRSVKFYYRPPIACARKIYRMDAYDIAVHGKKEKYDEIFKYVKRMNTCGNDSTNLSRSKIIFKNHITINGILSYKLYMGRKKTHVSDALKHIFAGDADNLAKVNTLAM